MTPELENPFHSIDSAYQLMTLLAATIVEARQELETDIERDAKLNLSRRLNAVRVTLYNLKKLESDINRSRRLLNDLRTLGRLLFEERAGVSSPSASGESIHSPNFGRSIASLKMDSDNPCPHLTCQSQQLGAGSDS